ncbi:hypothetical protein FSP39_010599 [Pinctada imbricata]|uniref:Cadherin domain-containing protein n=1 Tax=Pinctada imbricata TaxID=66713 RepID=A0AA89C3J2_PINIB|nr:hypothetical protein FSP39_010599 [Pinctada imbricata]
MEKVKTVLLVLVCTALVSVCSAVVTYAVDEERAPNVIIGNIMTVIDEDPQVTDDMIRDMRFALLSDSQHVDKFAVEERSGSLHTTVRLDREEICPFRVICKVRVKVGATSGSYYRTVTVDILIEDINDNAPTFPNASIALSISEGSTLNSTFPILSASDRDMGPNNSIKEYVLIPNTGMFALDIHPKIDGTSDLSLRLIQTLDREDKDRYTIYVKAKDGGNPPKSGTLIVNISVSDVNDNAPVFTQDLYNITIQEDIPLNTVITRVSANDADTGKNAEVTYRFSVRQTDDISIYGISQTSGEVSVIGQPEYEPNKPFYRIVVEASDSGTIVRKSSQVEVFVYINDTNNNAPQITINLLSNGQDFAVIKENANIGDVTAHIDVKDEDMGINGLVNCTLNNKYFRLQQLSNVSNEYKVVVKSEIDREEKIEHVITIHCHDGGTPSLNSSASFIVQVQDENDNAPTFTNRVYVAQIDENKPAQSIVVKVSATDPDQSPNGQVRYYLGPEAQFDFTINPTDGIIRTKTVFDREVQSSINFTVLAVDGGSPVTLTGTATVQLRINDENDITPTFNKSHWEFIVKEELNTTSIGFIKAYDLDAGDNGRITFYMKIEDLARVPFDITPYGEIHRTARLDREQKDRYQFDVIARDNGVHTRSNSTQVTVIIEDVNDNAPKFVFPDAYNSTVTILYTALENSLVTTLSATDIDYAENAEITYGIIGGNGDGIFKIDKFSGEILLARKIGKNEIKIYDLIVTAEDNGLQEQRLTRHPLSVHVKFVNVTAISSLPVEEHPQNLIIAIVIAALTVIISVAIISVICVIRRIDMRKHNYPAKNIEEMKIMENMARNNSNRSSSSKGSREQMVPSVIYKNGKKEVSFSLDEDDTNISYSFPSTLSDTNPSMITFKSTSPLTVQLPQHHSRESSTLSDTKAKELNRIESLRYHQRLMQSRSPNSKWQLQGKKFPESSMKEDNHSDMSEESTTGDSGRGGSEEDVRNSGLSHPSESTIERSHSSMSSHQLSPIDTSGISSGPVTPSATRLPSLSTFGHGPSKSFNHGMSTFPRNNNTKHSTPLDSRQSMQHSTQGQSSKVQRLHSEHYPSNQRPVIDIPRVPSDLQSSKQYLDHDKSMQRTRHLNFPRQSEETLVSESCNTTVRDDDDVTTTSGSYTINPDDLCNEIDELFFHKPSDTVV